MVDIDMKKGIYKPYVMFQTTDARLIYISPDRIVFEKQTRDSLGVPKWEAITTLANLDNNLELIHFLIAMGKEMVRQNNHIESAEVGDKYEA